MLSASIIRQLFNCLLDPTPEKAYTFITTINNQALVQNPKTIGESEGIFTCNGLADRAAIHGRTSISRVRWNVPAQPDIARGSQALRKRLESAHCLSRAVLATSARAEEAALTAYHHGWTELVS